MAALSAGMIALALFAMSQASFADPLRNRIFEHQGEQVENETLADGASSKESANLPAGIRITRDVPYGSDALQRFDVYSQAQAKGAPVILMVHGGGWFRGDKAMRAVVENKVARWLPRGFVVISTNYRMVPKADPIEQARDVARAIAAAQQSAASWGGDPSKFILIGHSAGAHLVALLATAPALSSGFVSTPWLGTIALDSAALDVVKIMEARHARLYDRAFKRDPEYWRSASPYYAMTAAGRPILAVCSTRRDDSCPQAKRFVTRATAIGSRAFVLEQNLSHRDVNQRLGEEPAYTAAVEAFLESLDGSVATLLATRLP
jgi:acetyl esterase/lipase